LRYEGKRNSFTARSQDYIRKKIFGPYASMDAHLQVFKALPLFLRYNGNFHVPFCEFEIGRIVEINNQHAMFAYQVPVIQLFWSRMIRWS